MAPRPIVLFYNPNSGRYNVNKIVALEKLASETLGYCRTIFDVELLRKVKNSHVIVAGGDGTFHVAINNSDIESNTYTMVAMGSGNDFVSNFPAADFEEIMEHIALGQIIPIDLLLVNHVLAHNVAGMGFEAFIAKKANESRIKGSALKYIIPVIQHLYFFRSLKIEINSANYQYKGKAFMLSFGNGRRAGGGFRLFPEASAIDGKMDVLLIKKPTALQKIRYAFLVNFGMHIGLKMIDYFKAEKVEVSAEKSILFEADGESYEAKKLSVKVLPGVLKVVQ